MNSKGRSAGKGGDGIGVGTEAGLGQSGGHADHVLLGHADIDEAVRKAGAKRLHDHVAQVAGEQDDAFVVGRETAESVNEGFSQLAASTSRIAISNS